MSFSKSPLFSVIIPTHNRCDVLLRAVQSVVSQTFQDFELIIVDDASTDGTDMVVGALNDKRIVYLRRATNGGAGASRNSGIVHAKGHYVTFLDDDDEYLPEFLEVTRAAHYSADEAIGFSWCGIRWINDRTGDITVEETWRPRYADKEQAYLSFMRSRRIGTNSGICIRKDCFNNVGMFDEELRGGAEDTDFFIRLVRRYEFVVINRALINVHLHDSAHLRTYGLEKARDYERIISKRQYTLKQHSQLAADMHYKAGWLYYRGGDKQNARWHMKGAIRNNPWQLKTWISLGLYELTGRVAPYLHSKLSGMRTTDA